MTAALSWLVDLPLEVYAIAAIVVTAFWSAVIMHWLDKRRVRLDAEWQKFVGRPS